MGKIYPPAWMAVTENLRTAALVPEQRDDLLASALQQLLSALPAAATALIWPCPHKKLPWKIYYAGARRNAMLRWLSARLDASIETMLGVLQQELTSGLPDMPVPLLLPLRISQSSPRAIWIVWSEPATQPVPSTAEIDWLEHVRLNLEALLEVEDKEEQYFSTSSPLYDPELIEAVSHGDKHALSAFLGLARVVAKADFTFWARAYQDVVEITSHLGAKHRGFGFTIPRGHGVGGRVAVYGKPIVGDYRNSPYREPSVCDLIDDEQVRSGLALPIHYHTPDSSSAHVAAVLYVTRRSTTHFSVAERLLAQRLTGLIEPIPLEIRPSSFYMPNARHLPEHKTDWHDIVLHANRVESVEAWASYLIKGEAIVTDANDRPYVFARSQQLEQLRVSCQGQMQVLSLAAPGVQAPGKVYLCPSIPLPPHSWPDFFADLIVACNLVITRMEQAQDTLGRQREQWIRSLLKGKSLQYVEQDGYRLGLPVEHGQVWILAWPVGSIQATKSTRKRAIAESVVLDSLKSPLTFIDDDMAVVFVDGPGAQPPSKVRDALLKHCGAQPLWIVHGARYRSLSEMRMTLTQTITLAQKARRENFAEYLLDIYTFGLDSLLENPRLTEDLEAFARKLLAPLLEYDTAYGSRLTETFVLAQTLGSAQAVADQLSVHVNTIRYRLHRAEEILSTEQVSPKERTARALAAFIWTRFHTSEPPVS
jgi:hypothetical protein